MPRRIDPDTIGFLISDVARLLRAEFDRRTSDAGLGLSPGEARALSHVARAGSVRQSVLAERMGVEAMTLSTYVDKLEARGLVERTPDPSDRRAKLVGITDAAEPVLEDIIRISAALRSDMSGGLAPEKVDELREMLKQIRANLVEMKPECSRKSSAA
ncbi:MarR family transcriptional regulator [Mesorhizobium sp. CAU 1732]|uniref:MarR family winged helix-turn-helix transcriptional regulator n=1 Tax=Mesorhizobium sp. CAU 1732 TaxID=3140358 RepID=UPI00325FE48E